MKKMSKLITVAVVVFAVTSLSQSVLAQLKVGYINSQRILQEYKGAQEVQDQLNSKNEEWQKEAQQMQQKMQELNDQLESQSLLLSEEKKDEKTREIQELYAKYQKFQIDKWGQGGEAFQLRDKLMQPILDKINTVIEKIGKEENYDYIFDGVSGNIVYANPNQPDLTNRVLEELGKESTDGK